MLLDLDGHFDLFAFQTNFHQDLRTLVILHKNLASRRVFVQAKKPAVVRKLLASPSRWSNGITFVMNIGIVACWQWGSPKKVDLTPKRPQFYDCCQVLLAGHQLFDRPPTF